MSISHPESEREENAADEPDLPALTDRQQRFVDAYLGDFFGNATQSARAAGFAGDDDVLATQGWRLLRNVKVSAHIDRYLTKQAMTRGEVLAELARVATAPMEAFQQIVKPSINGQPAIIKQDLSSKVKALELLAKYHGMLVDRRETSESGEIIVKVVHEQRSRLRARVVAEIAERSEDDRSFDEKERNE